MCRPASMVVTKTAVFWGQDDSHEAVIRDNNIHMDGARGPNGVRVEIVPPDDGDMCSPVSKWVYHLDEEELANQDKLPTWYDHDKVEARVRKELSKWIKVRVVRKGKTRTVAVGECVFNYGMVKSNYGMVESNYGMVESNDGTVKSNYSMVKFNDGTVKFNYGMVESNDGTVKFNDGTVKFNHSTVKFNDGTVKSNYSTVEHSTKHGKCEEQGKNGVTIDRSVSPPKCYVGP